MPKYRFLSDEELKHFDLEFKQFLIVNHLYAEEWALLNKENPEKALEIVGLFSDEILETIYKKITFLEKLTIDSCFVFFFDKEKIELKVIQSSNKDLDLSTAENLHKAMVYHFKDLSFFKSTRKYTNHRETEIHLLLEQGATPSSKDFWELLEKIIP